MQFKFTLPKQVYILPDDKVDVGIFYEGKWSTDNITKITFDPNKKEVSFWTFTLAPHAFIADRCLDYPYNGFRLRCVEPEVALLDINTKRIDLRFKIGPGWVQLVDREEDEFAHITDKKLEPGMLLKELYNCGVNLLPVVDDAISANIF